MFSFIFRRFLVLIPTLFIVSVVSFFLIQLPPGDYLTTMAANLSETGEPVDAARMAALKVRYGLDQPMPIQYLKWMGGVLHGNFGESFALEKPVGTLIWERLGLTISIALTTILLTWLIALPIGIYSATHPYSLSDTFFTFLGFIGMATPSFLLALVLMYVSYTHFGTSVGGLFSDAMIDAPWSWAKVIDLLKHLWVPVAVLAVGSTAGLIREIRANLLDQLEMPYVVTARAKGLPEWRLVLKYPVRVAINPMISTLGWMLPQLISGSVIVDIVLSLQTTGPLMLTALLDQDMYLAGSFVFLLSCLTVLGTLISDLLLAWVDPRIRFGKMER